MKPNKKIFSLRWLLFAVLIATAVSSVTMSRYMTTVTGTATAQIAKFDVTLNEAQSSASMTFTGLKPGSTQTYQFSVASESDVNVILSAKIEGANSLPLTYTITRCSSGGKTTPMDVDLDRDNMTRFDSIDYGKVTNTYTLEISWPDTDKKPQYSNTVGAWKLVILAEQAS